MAISQKRGLPKFPPKKPNLNNGTRNRPDPIEFNDVFRTPPKTTPASNLPAKPERRVFSYQEPPKGLVPVRDYAYQKGFRDIGWDDSTKRVTLGENAALTPAKIINGTSYARPEVIDQALRYAGYQDPQVKRFNEFRQQKAELMRDLQRQINQPMQYDPENDPRYQAYRELAQQRAEDASLAAMETLNERGILNSSVTRDDIAEIEQAAEQQALGAIPQFYSQAQQERQQDISNLMNVIGLLSGEAQQSFRNQLAQDELGLQRRDADLREMTTMAELTGYLPDGTPTSAEQQRQLENLWMAAQQTGRIGPELAEIYGLEPGTPTFEAAVTAKEQALRNRQLDISAMNAQTSRMNANLRGEQAERERLYEIWKNQGYAPKGLEKYGIKEGTPYSVEEEVENRIGEIAKDVQRLAYEEVPNPEDPYAEPIQQFNEEKAKIYILSQNLPDNQTEALFQMFGIDD